MIEYLALDFLESMSLFIGADTTYKTKFFFAFMIFNLIIIVFLYSLMGCIGKVKRHRK
jgi:hypothetical protein